jgi:hypothetical protein
MGLSTCAFVISVSAYLFALLVRITTVCSCHLHIQKLQFRFLRIRGIGHEPYRPSTRILMNAELRLEVVVSL